MFVIVAVANGTTMARWCKSSPCFVFAVAVIVVAICMTRLGSKMTMVGWHFG